LERVIKNKINK